MVFAKVGRVRSGPRVEDIRDMSMAVLYRLLITGNQIAK
jgi:hypothetical protein